MNILFYIFSIVFIIGLDQYSKKLINLIIEPGSNIELINNFLYFTNIKNHGAGFSILQNQRLLLIIVPLILMIILFYYLIKNNKKLNILNIISFIFIIGGGIGNLIDRIRLGFVTDFIDVKIFSYHYPTFNIADSFVTIGAILLFIYLAIDSKKNGKSKNNS